ncbi:hypothetical protein OB13_15835, partial [Pontibacter sp. HJ8]
MRNYLLLPVLFILLTGTVQAQLVQPPVGSFNRDTIRIGEVLSYTLVHQHAAPQEVILPDSSYNFHPFELVGQTYYPTATRAGISSDSTVYLLRTFEMEPVQTLALPAFVLHGQDTVQVFAKADSVVLRQLVNNVQEPLILRTQTELAPVEERFNWPIVLLWVVTVAAFLA